MCIHILSTDADHSSGEDSLPPERTYVVIAEMVGWQGVPQRLEIVAFTSEAVLVLAEIEAGP